MCDIMDKYPWDPVARDMLFPTKGAQVVIHPNKPAQFIIVGRENPDFLLSVKPVLVSEIEAFGELAHENLIPRVPPENEIPDDYHVVSFFDAHQISISGSQSSTSASV